MRTAWVNAFIRFSASAVANGSVRTQLGPLSNASSATGSASGSGASPFSSISTWTGENVKPVAWKAIVCRMPSSSPRVPDAAHPRTRVVWLDGRIVPSDRARVSADDPGVRWGLGLFETMRAAGGRVPLLDRHLERLLTSAATLGLGGVPDEAALRDAVAAALAAGDSGPARVRLTVTPRPTLLVEVTPVDGVPWGAPGEGSAVTLRGAWVPGDRIAEHKTLSYAAWRLAQRDAEAAGADHALLLAIRCPARLRWSC